MEVLMFVLAHRFSCDGVQQNKQSTDGAPAPRRTAARQLVCRWHRTAQDTLACTWREVDAHDPRDAG